LDAACHPSGYRKHGKQQPLGFVIYLFVQFISAVDIVAKNTLKVIFSGNQFFLREINCSGERATTMNQKTYSLPGFDKNFR